MAHLFDYPVSPRGYLKRAREQIITGTAQSLFYAAYELRCFVESRQDEYLEAQREYAQSVPKAWKIGAQGKALEAIFESTRIQHVAWLVDDKKIMEAYYIPVQIELRKSAEKLGDLLHARREWVEPDGSWWKKTMADLRSIYELASQCNHGTLLSPMLLVDGHAIGKMVINLHDGGDEEMLSSMMAGTHGVLKVEYLNSVPDDWQSDLGVF